MLIVQFLFCPTTVSPHTVLQKQRKRHTSKSPEMLAPARIPVAAGKKMAKTEKKPSPFVKRGPKFSANIDAATQIMRKLSCKLSSQSRR